MKRDRSIVRALITTGNKNRGGGAKSGKNVDRSFADSISPSGCLNITKWWVIDGGRTGAACKISSFYRVNWSKG